MDLNGLVGVSVSFEEVTKRYRVNLDDGFDPVSVKHKYLTEIYKKSVVSQGQKYEIEGKSILKAIKEWCKREKTGRCSAFSSLLPPALW